VANWKQRVRDLARQRPDAVPVWLSQPTTRAWYRVKWQTDGGVNKANARRPLLVVLQWLHGKSLLTKNGNGTLNFMLANEPVDESLSISMVNSTAVAFLDRCWDSWWSNCGINLAIDSAVESSAAITELDRLWSTYSNDESDEQSDPPKSPVGREFES